MKRYYAMQTEGDVADIDIYGDIVSWEWLESDMSAYTLSNRIRELVGVSQINVHINSYGGEVAEGLAIYNALKRHPANVVTTCDGMACSAASVVFMAGDERVMCGASLLMIHNAWTYAQGDAAAMRKAADDIETITEASKQAYLEVVSIDEAELGRLMDEETWISAADALDMGFATAVESFAASEAPSQSARQSVFDRLTATAPADVSAIAEQAASAALRRYLALGDDGDYGSEGDPGVEQPDCGGDGGPDDIGVPDDENEKQKAALRMTERFLSAITTKE